MYFEKIYIIMQQIYQKKESKMALPFIAGLIIGGGAVYAYNNRDELKKQVKAKSKDLKAGLKKGEEAFGKVSTSIKTGAKNLTNSLKSVASTAQSTKSAKPKAPRNPKSVKKSTELKTATLSLESK